MSAPWSEVEAAVEGVFCDCRPTPGQAHSIHCSWLSQLRPHDGQPPRLMDVLLAVLRPLWDRQAEALAEAEKRAAETEADVRARLLMEMTEERMRSALGDTAFERDAAQAGEVIQRTLAQHFERERDKARAALAAAEAREGALREAAERVDGALETILDCARNDFEQVGGPEATIEEQAAHAQSILRVLLAAAPPSDSGSKLLELLADLEESKRLFSSRAGDLSMPERDKYAQGARIYESVARRLRKALGLPPREEASAARPPGQAVDRDRIALAEPRAAAAAEGVEEPGWCHRPGPTSLPAADDLGLTEEEDPR